MVYGWYWNFPLVVGNILLEFFFEWVLPPENSKIFLKEWNVRNREEFQYIVALIASPILTHSFPMHPFCTPQNIRKPYGFQIFSGGRERVHLEQIV